LDRWEWSLNAPRLETLWRAQQTAHDPGDYVDQQSFMRAGEIRTLAHEAGITEGTSVLDLCCGIGGPGRLIASELGCDYLGIDHDPEAIRIARNRARELPCRFEVGDVPPVPRGTYDVVLLLETMLGFADKEALLAEISGALNVGGRFAFTVEVGRPLSAEERQRMPNAGTVWLTRLATMRRLLEKAGFVVRETRDLSAAHSATAAALLNAYAADGPAIAADIGQAKLDDLVAAHRLWVEWLESGRVRKVSVVAAKTEDARRRLSQPTTSTTAPGRLAASTMTP
jgi:SAM-dependent methyltransferase